LSDPSSLSKFVPASLGKVKPDDMDQLNNIFALIKADLALAPTEDMERDLQQVTLTDNLTSLLERANVENVQEKVQDFVGDI